jgi:hypothetical protein
MYAIHILKTWSAFSNAFESVTRRDGQGRVVKRKAATLEFRLNKYIFNQ